MVYAADIIFVNGIKNIVIEMTATSQQQEYYKN
jgi:hypothetical protein